jgi:alcohol dehydrogenase
MNIKVLALRDQTNSALAKYAQIGRLLTGRNFNDAEACVALVDTLENWTHRLHLPHLGYYQVTKSDIPRIVANCRGSSMKTNPINLTDEDIAEVLLARI